MERDALPQGQGAGSVTQVVEANLYREASLLEESPERAHHGVASADLALRVREDKSSNDPRKPLIYGPGPSRKPDSALRRLTGLRVLGHVGECPVEADFREILVETCRSESASVGVGWGNDWGQWSKSDWLTSSNRGCH